MCHLHHCQTFFFQCLADKPVAELRVCFKRPNLEQQHTSPVPTKITVMPPRSAGHTLPGRTGSFVPLKVSCVENSCIVGHSSPSKWTQLDHPSYDIFIQERDPFLAQIDQVRKMEILLWFSWCATFWKVSFDVLSMASERHFLCRYVGVLLLVYVLLAKFLTLPFTAHGTM